MIPDKLQKGQFSFKSNRFELIWMEKNIFKKDEKTEKKRGSVVMKVKKQTQILRILDCSSHLSAYSANLPIV